MGKRILIGCYEVPGYGGASTAGYDLSEMMQEDGFDVHFVNLIEEQDKEYFAYMFGPDCGNPRFLANVYNCVLNGALLSPHPELTCFMNEVDPDILLGIGWIAALLMKRASPQRRLIFLTTGCEQVKSYVVGKRRGDFFSQEDFKRRRRGSPKLFHEHEKEAVRVSDYIITHSDMIRSLYHDFFPFHLGKMCPDVIWFAEWIRKDALAHSGLQKPFCERDIDILFVSSSWARREKNYDLVKRIVSRCKAARVHVVGEVGKKYAPGKYHGLLARRADLFSLMGRAKAVICPSLFDAAPGILFEASAMGCNIIATKSCGNWRICNKDLLVDPPHLRCFLQKIALSLSSKYEDNVDYFLSRRSYKSLVDIISVFS